MYLCYQFLLDRSKGDDYNSPLARAMLEMMSLFTTLTEDLLEKTHIVKVLPRYAKRGDAKTQFYAKRIASNAAAAATKDKTAEAPAKTSAVKQTNAASPTSKRAEPEPVAGIKRSASTAGDGGAQKKVATGATKTNGLSTATKQTAPVKKTTATLDSIKPAAGIKTKQVVAKPSGLFSSLQSATKKPGTSNATKTSQSSMVAATSKPAEKKATPSVQPSAPKSTFSFAETMANLSKPKEEKPAAKQEKQAPPETPEEKAKRLRKEARRQLHVCFKDKDGGDLVEVHIFHHDPEEELGHDASQMRDVSDVGGEGRMFKQQHQRMDVDEEEDATEEEEKLIDFKQPNEIDFTAVDSEERNRNYAPFGGGALEPESAERAVREHYEANTLIVFYAELSDIPLNPREPSDPYNGEQIETVKKLGAPEEKYAVRARQKKSGQLQHYQAPQQPAIQHNSTPSFDLSKLASFMGSQQNPQQNTYQTAPQPAASSSNDHINSILASLKQSAPNQATPPPPMMSSYGNSYPAASPNLSAALTQQPSMQSNDQPDLAAILAQITQNQPSAAPAPAMGGYGYGASGGVPNMMGYPQQMQQPTMFVNPERKQWLEGGGENNMSRNNRQNPALNPYYKTKVCKYWQEGRCQKGDQCSYKHEES